MNFKLYQMDVKSAFLNIYIEEEVCVSQPLSFEDHKNHTHVYKLKKALYGLKQAPIQWFDGEKFHGLFALLEDQGNNSSLPSLTFQTPPTSYAQNLHKEIY